MNAASARLVLAFDASCAQCRRISDAVALASGDRLEVLPLNHSDVSRWREEWFGEQAPWVPTLIRVDGNNLRIWTGRGMALPLVRGLGPRSTLRVLRALGELRDQRQESTPEPGAMGRKRFIWVAGASVAAGLILRGKTPASADSAATQARAWVTANRDQLPQRYDQVAALPLAHRRAVFVESSAEVRAQLWLDHLDRYRSAHSGLAKSQTEVIDRARALVPKAFGGSREALRPELTRLKEDAITAFGGGEAAVLLATLGPTDAPVSAQQADCECANLDPLCTFLRQCSAWPVGCNYDDSGCGTFWIWPCDGLCHW